MKGTIIFLLLAACSNRAVAQPIHQNKLIAAQQIKERQIYEYTLVNGKATGDSILVGYSEYNALGYPLLNISIDPTTASRHKVVTEYLHDSVIVKITFYTKDDSISSISTYGYDSLGKHVKNTNHFLRPSKTSPDTSFYFIVYDQQNRIKESCLDEGKGKKYSVKYEYDALGNMVKYYSSDAAGKSLHVEGLAYDSRRNIVRNYDLDGGKKRLLVENTYNALNQRVEKRTFSTRKVKKHFFSLEYRSKKRNEHLVKYYYDPTGLLRWEERYFNSKCIGQYRYNYTSATSGK